MAPDATFNAVTMGPADCSSATKSCVPLGVMAIAAGTLNPV